MSTATPNPPDDLEPSAPSEPASDEIVVDGELPGPTIREATRYVAAGAAQQEKWWVASIVILVMAFVVVATKLGVAGGVTGTVAVLSLVALVLADTHRKR